MHGLRWILLDHYPPINLIKIHRISRAPKFVILLHTCKVPFMQNSSHVLPSSPNTTVTSYKINANNSFNISSQLRKKKTLTNQTIGSSSIVF